ncbi:PAS domain-containing protein [Rhizobium sp. FY34]|uniref:PAS domain-containing protein n=1 Tax=Rhizobium sp. FY34 TaxID=2562309 RepID=UPI0010C06C59|nr:PAS domain-containing protein [Rhizobium sp. FY34]
MQSTRSNEVFTYWNSLRHGRAAPSRAQIDPSALRHRLPDLFMLDWEGPQLKFRLGGTRVCELFGHELRDTRFLSLWVKGSYDSANEAALAALRMEEAVLMDIVLSTVEDAVACEMLLMPLRSPSGVVDRLLGCFMPLVTAHRITPLAGASMTLARWSPVNAQAAEQEEEETDLPHDSLFRRLTPQRLAQMARDTLRW